MTTWSDEDGADLRARRRALGLKQRHIAEALGVDTSSVCLWESAKNRPSAQHREALLALLDGIWEGREQLLRAVTDAEVRVEDARAELSAARAGLSAALRDLKNHDRAKAASYARGPREED